MNLRNIVIATIISMSALSSSCVMKSRDSSFVNPGIYECKPREGYSGPTFKLDTEDPNTLILSGSRSGLEFKDLNTDRTVTLYEDSNLPYHCKRVGDSK